MYHLSNPTIIVIMLIFADGFMVSKESFSFHSSYEKILLQKLEQSWWPLRVGMRIRKPRVPSRGWQVGENLCSIYSILEKMFILAGGCFWLSVFSTMPWCQRDKESAEEKSMDTTQSPNSLTLLKIGRWATRSLWDPEGFLYSEPKDTGNVEENICGQYDSIGAD